MARYCILGDVHSNIIALETVLADCSEKGVDHFLCVGDVVGYGADPSACIAKLKEISCQVVQGNHDEAAVSDEALKYFNPFARTSILWTREHLSPEELKWLADLPEQASPEPGVQVFHASPWMPKTYPYVQSLFDAEQAFSAQESAVCFIGHSHFPVVFLRKGAETTYSFEHQHVLNGWEKALVNVGSVGQPRDENPLTGYMIYDSATTEATLYRIPYNIEEASKRIMEAGLPEINAERLRVGR